MKKAEIEKLNNNNSNNNDNNIINNDNKLYKKLFNNKLFNKHKLPPSLLSFILSLIFIFTLSLPIISKTINYTPLTALAIDIIPSKTYTITFNLPYPSNKKITKSEIEKAEEGLSKAFNIPLSSLKPNEHLSTPTVYLNRNAITKTYRGYIKIGNNKLNFSKIKVSFSTEQQNKQSNKTNNTEPISKTLLTAYFTLNNKPLRANIFLIDNGSILQYASMTIQDNNDNVLAMFRYGKMIRKNSSKKDTNTAYAKTYTSVPKYYGNAKYVTRRFNIKYIQINDHLSGINYYEPGSRTDAMSVDPFSTFNGASQSVAMKTWGFQNRISDAYRSIYQSHYGNGYAITGIYKITNKYRLHYSADIVKGFPEPHNFNKSWINLSFNLEFLSISYPLYVSGTELTWSMSSDLNSFYNVATNTIETPAPWSSDTFDNDWNSSIQWKEGDYSYSYRTDPDSLYKGYFTKVSINSYSYYNHYFGDFYSTVYYSIQAGSGALYDWYYITVSQTFNDVRLDQ